MNFEKQKGEAIDLHRAKVVAFTGLIGNAIEIVIEGLASQGIPFATAKELAELLDHAPIRVVHVFRGALTVPTTELQLREGQDLRLVTLEELRSGSIWSDHCGEARPTAPGLRIVIDRLMTESHGS